MADSKYQHESHQVTNCADHFVCPMKCMRDVFTDEIIRVVKSITAKGFFKDHPEVKNMLCVGNFWTEVYFSTVGRKAYMDVIAEYGGTRIC